MNRQSIWDSFLEEMSSCICARLCEKDPAYAQKRDLVGKQEDALRERVEALDARLWEQIEDYVAAVDALAGEEIKAAYLQGAGDFARVMAKTE